jgi:hypothetical protein
MTKETAAKKAPDPTTRVAEALERKQRRAEFDTIPTGIDGISLRHERDVIPEMTIQMAGRLAVAASEYVKQKQIIDDISALQVAPEEELKQAASRHRGLRGFDSELTNSRLAITPKLSIEWHREALKQLLSSNYNAVVHERIQANIAVPLGLETDEGPLSSDMLVEALRRGLATLGLGKEATSSMIATSIETEVDEPELANMLADGRLTDLPASVASVNETWSISVNPLHKKL